MFAIFEAIKSFIEFIISVVGFVIALFRDLVFAIGTMRKVVLRLPGLLGFFPTAVIALFLAGISILVVFRVLGRD